MNVAPVAASFSAFGTTATVLVTNPAALPAAREQLVQQLGAVDRACSRFRPDSELVRANSRAGSWVRVGPILARFLRFALDAAELSDGLLDPTVGARLREVGYDRTFTLLRERERWHIIAPRERNATWADVELDDDGRLLRVPPGVELDLGATAKALAADEAAGTIAASWGCGVLVSLGGDLAVGGDGPSGGWPVLIAHDHATTVDSAGPAVSITTGGLATSSTAVRRWQTDSGEAHHILDPRTGRSALTPWRTVTVAATTCALANVAATTALISGEAGPTWLSGRQLPARCVRQDGSLVTVGGWPEEVHAA